MCLFGNVRVHPRPGVISRFDEAPGRRPRGGDEMPRGRAGPATTARGDGDYGRGVISQTGVKWRLLQLHDYG